MKAWRFRACSELHKTWFLISSIFSIIERQIPTWITAMRVLKKIQIVLVTHENIAVC